MGDPSHPSSVYNFTKRKYGELHMSRQIQEDGALCGRREGCIIQHTKSVH